MRVTGIRFANVDGGAQSMVVTVAGLGSRLVRGVSPMVVGSEEGRHDQKEGTG